MSTPTEIRQYTLTLPAGTQPVNPVLLDMAMPARDVSRIQVVVPPGCNGVVGWRILNSGLRVIPYAGDEWVITSGETIDWPVFGQITSGAWGAAGFNLGINDHSVYIRMITQAPTPPVATGLARLAPNAALNGGAG